MKRDNADLYQARIAEYERRKAEWVRAHPEATHQEYQQAMTRIARETGV